MSEEEIAKLIREWKYFWMNQRQNSQEDFENYFNRAFGIDANMIWDLAKRMHEALKAGESK